MSQRRTSVDKIQDTDNVFAGFTSACAQAGATGCSIATSGSTSESIRQWTLTLMDAAYDYLKKGGNFGSSYIRSAFAFYGSSGSITLVLIIFFCLI